MEVGVCVIIVGKSWQQGAWWEEAKAVCRLCDALGNILLGNRGDWHTYGCDTANVPKHCYRPSTPFMMLRLPGNRKLYINYCWHQQLKRQLTMPLLKVFFPVSLSFTKRLTCCDLVQTGNSLLIKVGAVKWDWCTDELTASPSCGPQPERVPDLWLRDAPEWAVCPRVWLQASSDVCRAVRCFYTPPKHKDAYWVVPSSVCSTYIIS